MKSNGAFGIEYLVEADSQLGESARYQRKLRCELVQVILPTPRAYLLASFAPLRGISVPRHVV